MKKAWLLIYLVFIPSMSFSLGYIGIGSYANSNLAITADVDIIGYFRYFHNYPAIGYASVGNTFSYDSMNGVLYSPLTITCGFESIFMLLGIEFSFSTLINLDPNRYRYSIEFNFYILKLQFYADRLFNDFNYENHGVTFGVCLPVIDFFTYSDYENEHNGWRSIFEK